MTNPSVQEQPHVGMGEREKRVVAAASTGAVTESIGAAGAIVLAILGLAGILPTAMMAVTTIVLGAAILLDAGAVSARHDRLVGETLGADARRLRALVGGGISAESLAGVAGIALGILALLGVAPIALCSVALIAFGAGLLFGSAAKGRFASLHTSQYGTHESARHIIDETLHVSAGAEVLVGIGAVVLGILALLGLQPVTLILVGFLSVGATMLLSGSALGARMFGILRHAR
jgi:hypothetical protein